MRFSFDVPRLSWLNGKTHKSCFASRKNKSGHLLEHIAAAGENASRAFATEVDKALTPQDCGKTDTQTSVEENIRT